MQVQVAANHPEVGAIVAVIVVVNATKQTTITGGVVVVTVTCDIVKTHFCTAT